MAITSLSDLVNALANKQQAFHFHKINTTAEAGGSLHDLCLVTGMPGSVATPATIAANGTTYTSATAGFFDYTAPAEGEKTYIASATAVNKDSLTAITIYDRLWACSAIPMTVTNTTTVVPTPPVLPRYTDGLGVELYYYCLGTPSSQSGTIINVSYTNSEGVSGRTATISVSVGATPFAVTGTLVKAQLQAGDKGVQSIASVTNTLTMSGGNQGLLLLKRLLDVIPPLNLTGSIVGPLRSGLVEIPNGTALGLMGFTSGTTTGILSGSVFLVQG